MSRTDASTVVAVGELVVHAPVVHMAVTLLTPDRAGASTAVGLFAASSPLLSVRAVPPGIAMACGPHGREIPGGKSSVRFKAGQLDFIVRTALAPSAVDPNSVYCLRKMNATKKRRELVIMAGHVSPVEGSSTVNLARDALPVNFSKYGSSSLKLTTAELPP